MENRMENSLRIFSSFMTVCPGVSSGRPINNCAREGQI